MLFWWITALGIFKIFSVVNILFAKGVSYVTNLAQ